MPRLSQPFKAMLSDILIRRKLAYRDVAHRTGFSHTTIRNWAAGEVPSDPQFVRELADGLEIPRVPLLEAAEYKPNQEDGRHDYEHFGIGSPQPLPTHGKTEAEQSEIYKALISFGGRVDVLKAVNIGVGKPEQALFLYHCTGNEGLEGFERGRMYAFVEPGDPGDPYAVEIGKSVLVEDRETWDIRVYRGPATGRVLAVMVGELLLNHVQVPEVLIQ